jgi:hypothetical protein
MEREGEHPNPLPPLWRWLGRGQDSARGNFLLQGARFSAYSANVFGQSYAVILFQFILLTFVLSHLILN